ncbi:MAG: C40 family peptidase [Deltaproteobacteria bacterium]|jgi:cell wall-associated NlpC family hydrolase|nr:C40 family peptidase [Deltaproteobacteria bacterium]
MKKPNSLLLLLAALVLLSPLAGCGGKRAKPSPRAAEIITTAHKYIGVPYVYGGRSPKGFDCSGLVWYVYRQHGVELPDSSRKQAAKGERIDFDEILPGDLIFFQSNGTVNHVGLYIGGGEMIHAPGRGKKVRKANISDSYYRKHFALVRRVI